LNKSPMLKQRVAISGYSSDPSGDQTEIPKIKTAHWTSKIRNIVLGVPRFGPAGWPTYGEEGNAGVDQVGHGAGRSCVIWPISFSCDLSLKYKNVGFRASTQSRTAAFTHVAAQSANRCLRRAGCKGFRLRAVRRCQPRQKTPAQIGCFECAPSGEGSHSGSL